MEKGGYHSASSNPSDFTYRKSEETKQKQKEESTGGGHDPKEPTDHIPSAERG